MTEKSGKTRSKVSGYNPRRNDEPVVSLENKNIDFLTLIN